MKKAEKTMYRPIAAEQVPADVRFDVLAQDQGQIVELAWGGRGRPEHGPGDLYKRVRDRSTGRTTFYRREG